MDAFPDYSSARLGGPALTAAILLGSGLATLLLLVTRRRLGRDDFRRTWALLLVVAALIYVAGAVLRGEDLRRQILGLSLVAAGYLLAAVDGSGRSAGHRP